MNNDIAIFLGKIDPEKELVISLDLDNTLVNRSKGGNYVDASVLAGIKDLLANKNTHLIINTGRDHIGLSSFSNEVIAVNDAVMGSGSLVMADNQIYFNKTAEILPEIVSSFIKAAESGKLIFMDIYHSTGRTIFYNDEGSSYKDLFYGQNPREWFGEELPPMYHVRDVEKCFPKEIFRIEVPVLKSDEALFEALTGKKAESIKLLSDLVEEVKIIDPQYNFKRKVFFVDAYKGKVIFGRYEHAEEVVNKGKGLLFWFGKKNFDPNDFNIIHIGDKDKGIVNDVIIKKMIDGSLIVMVGDDCSFDNPDIDLYLRGDIEAGLSAFFGQLADIR